MQKAATAAKIFLSLSFFPSLIQTTAKSWKLKVPTTTPNKASHIYTQLTACRCRCSETVRSCRLVMDTSLSFLTGTPGSSCASLIITTRNWHRLHWFLDPRHGFKTRRLWSLSIRTVDAGVWIAGMYMIGYILRRYIVYLFPNANQCFRSWRIFSIPRPIDILYKIRESSWITQRFGHDESRLLPSDPSDRNQCISWKRRLRPRNRSFETSCSDGRIRAHGTSPSTNDQLWHSCS